jgi:xanthine dehydrogenase YagR molybdenum-binding subunit
MAGWPENPRLISTKVPRLDGLAKAAGKAKYPSDMHPEGMLFGLMLYSPYAHAKVKSIDSSAAEKLPGVKAVVLIAKEGTELRYQGDDVAAVAAETEEQARDAIRAIKVDYEQLPFAVTEEQAMDSGTPKIFNPANFRRGAANTKGNPEEALGKSDATIEGSYSAPVITHVCLESHGLTAMWKGDDQIVAWASTQNVSGVANELAGTFKIPVSNVTVHTEVMGGGFGSKFGADIWGQTAARRFQDGGRPASEDVSRSAPGTPGGRQPAELRGNRENGCNQGRQDHRHDRRNARHRRSARRVAVPLPVCL